MDTCFIQPQEQSEPDIESIQGKGKNKIHGSHKKLYIIMKFLSKLFGNVGLDVNKLVDNVITTDAERMTLKAKFKEILTQAEGVAQEQVTRRWESDNKAGWLPANIRPLTLIFLTLVFVVISIFDGNVGGFTISPAYVPIYQTLLICCYSAYFAGRSIEKIKKK